MEDEGKEVAVAWASKMHRSQPAYVERADRKPSTTVFNDLADAFDGTHAVALPRGP